MVLQHAVVGGVVGLASEPMPLWRVLFWCALVASVLAVLCLTMLVRRKPRRSGLRALVVLLVVASLWGAFRITSNHRWRVNGITNDAIELFDLTEGGEVRKGSLLHHGACGLHDVVQVTTLVGVDSPVAETDGRGAIDGSVFALAERTARQLDGDGWNITRYERDRSLDDGTTTNELFLLAIHAERNGSYLHLTFQDFGLDIRTYTSACLAEQFGFGTPGTSRQQQVETFSA